MTILDVILFDDSLEYTARTRTRSPACLFFGKYFVVVEHVENSRHNRYTSVRCIVTCFYRYRYWYCKKDIEETREKRVFAVCNNDVFLPFPIKNSLVVLNFYLNGNLVAS
jgi:hypothetical protein